MLGAQAQLSGAGYYRVKNVTSGRYMSLSDNQSRGVDFNSCTADCGAMQTSKIMDNIYSDPGSIFYLDHISGVSYNVIGQGTSLHDIINYYIYISPVGSFYKIYQEQKGQRITLSDFDDVEEDEECYYEDVFIIRDNIDQIAEVIESIKNNPDSRRHIVSSWSVPEVNIMALPPCHTMFQFYVSDGYLDCKLYQRSADAFLGVPYNITSYSLLLMMIAQVTGLKPRRFIHTFGDAHIYLNHIEQVKEQLNRDCYELPEMKINPEITNIDNFKMSDFELVNYKSHDVIKAEMAV